MTYTTIDAPVRGGNLHAGRWLPAAGPAAVPVLAVHGVTATHLSWFAVAGSAPDLDIVAPDLRGRGGSRTLPGPAGMGQHADDLAALLDHLGIEKVVLAGHSMGAFVSVVMADRHPDRVERMLIVDGGLPLDVPAARWTVMQNAWGIDLPPGCDGCDSLGDALPFYARTMPLPHRFGLLAYIDDTVIPMFYAESSVHAGLVALEAPMNATTNQRYFYVNDHGHVVLGDDSQEAGTSGVSARQWVTQFATDDAAWASVGP